MSTNYKELTELVSLLKYKNRTGLLYWSKNFDRKNRVGQKAGCLTNRGYMQLRFKGKVYFAHRVIFFMHHGFLPEQIDHKDGIKSNNKIKNLRGANHSQNQQNSKKRTNNSSGYKGITWRKASKKWVVRIVVDRKSHHVGLYENIELAVKACNIARKKLHKEFFNSGGKRNVI